VTIVHPTALIDPAAALGANVEVGPFSIIGAEVRIGDGSVIQSHVVIEGAVEIGRETLIGHGSIVGGSPQDLGFVPGTHSSVRIGDKNVIREHCTIHRGTAEGSVTTIGDGNFLMAGVHVGHNCQIGDGVIIANNCLLAGYVRIDDRAVIGGGTIFHQNIHIGRLAMAQGRAGFVHDLPPFVLGAQGSVAVGVNIVGLRRAGFSGAEREDIKRAFKLLYRSGLNTRQAVAEAAQQEFGPLGRELFEFVAQPRKRGIVPYRKSRTED
jgi:UDP-N-acetylglucosamine acyltransferase